MAVGSKFTFYLLVLINRRVLAEEAFIICRNRIKVWSLIAFVAKQLVDLSHKCSELNPKVESSSEHVFITYN